MTELQVYLSGLLAAAFIVAATAIRYSDVRWQMLRTISAIALNWCVGASYAWFSSDYTPWGLSIAIDAAAAGAIMLHPAVRTQAYIGLFYFFQIACHVAFGFRGILGLETSETFYYDAITYIAWAQLAALGVWCGACWLPVHRVWRSGDAAHSRARNLHHGGKET